MAEAARNELQALRELIRGRGRLALRDFELGPTLGTGTFGRVRQARYRHGSCAAVFALKMLRKTEVVRLEQLEHIRSEKHVLAQLNHPFIVGFVAAFQTPQHVCLLFEYMPGGELFRHLRLHGRFAPDVTRFYAAEILLALRHLHARRVVYRDLKPENLLLSGEGHVKLADFGFAKVLPQDRTKTLCGTPEYLAPELIRGRRGGYGRSVDWWALGVLVYEMLAGFPPFYAKQPLGIYRRVLAGVVEFPQHFSSQCKDLVRGLLNPDCARRLGVADVG